MYFSATEYPALRGQAKRAVRTLITDALRRHDRWARWRFYGVLFMLLMLAAGEPVLEARWDLPQWSGLAVTAAAPLLFWIYMLWEINGPMHAAVMKHLAANGNPDGAET